MPALSAHKETRINISKLRLMMGSMEGEFERVWNELEEGRLLWQQDRQFLTDALENLNTHPALAEFE